MQLWEIISMLCQKVVEEQNVYLDIVVTDGCIELQLMPPGDEEDYEDEQ